MCLLLLLLEKSAFICYFSVNLLSTLFDTATMNDVEEITADVLLFLQVCNIGDHSSIRLQLLALWPEDGPRTEHSIPVTTAKRRGKALNQPAVETPDEPRQKLGRARDDSQELWNQGAVTTGDESPWQWGSEPKWGHRWPTETLQKQTADRPLDWLGTRRTHTQQTQTWIIQPPTHTRSPSAI